MESSSSALTSTMMAKPGSQLRPECSSALAPPSPSGYQLHTDINHRDWVDMDVLAGSAFARGRFQIDAEQPVERVRW